MTNIIRPVKQIGLIAVFMLSAMTLAKAENILFTFSGTITYLDDRELILDGSIANGTAFNGFYIFNSNASDTNTDATVGDYQFTTSSFGVVIKIGNYVFRTNPQNVDFLIEVVNRPERDNYLFRSYNNVCSRPLLVEHISWQLDDSGGTALTNALLPLTPPNLNEWESMYGLTVQGGGGRFLIRGKINSITETPSTTPHQPTLAILTAIELKWQSRLGDYYQIQSSEDMQTWTNVGEPVLGDGTELSRFFSRQSGSTFYRATIEYFQK